MDCNNIRESFLEHFDKEIWQITKHLNTCEACTLEYKKYRDTINLLQTLGEVPDNLHTQMMNAVKTHTAKKEQRRKLSRFMPIALAAASTLVFLFVLFSGALYQPFEPIEPVHAPFRIIEPEPVTVAIDEQQAYSIIMPAIIILITACWVWGIVMLIALRPNKHRRSQKL